MNLYSILSRTPFIKDILLDIKEKKILKEWEDKGRPLPGPGVFKRSVIKEYANDEVNVFIETGTYNGGMVEAVKNIFKTIFSIELDEKLAKKAQQRFSNYNHIKILQGDSGELIKDVLSKLNERAIFWLDAHYSGGYTARGSEDTPILKELKYILEHKIKNHIILIDDAREFTETSESYPSIKEVEEFIKKYSNKYSIEVKDDIIRVLLNL
jgi:hypothetical protein